MFDLFQKKIQKLISRIEIFERQSKDGESKMFRLWFCCCQNYLHRCMCVGGSSCLATWEVWWRVGRVVILCVRVSAKLDENDY